MTVSRILLRMNASSGRKKNSRAASFDAIESIIPQVCPGGSEGVRSLSLGLVLGLVFNVLMTTSAVASPKSCSLGTGALPRANDAPGIRDLRNPIEHIIVIMQENHSFDEYFGRLSLPAYYGTEIDGLNLEMSNPDSAGRSFKVYRHRGFCTKDTDHSWKGLHREWNLGANDGFVRTNGLRSMGFYEPRDLVYYYALANRFAVGDRYFSSVMGPTHPNRMYLWAGTSLGVIKTGFWVKFPSDKKKTIFDLMNEHGVTWKYYAGRGGYLDLFSRVYKENRDKVVPTSQFTKDLADQRLPQVVFLDSPEDKADEHHPQDVRIGQDWVAKRVNAFLQSAYWKKGVIFFTYDENGGQFDHVPPPLACAPDDVAPNTGSVTPQGSGFDRLGFRVPLVAISPYAKSHWVSHQVYDHASILKYIETKFNLPALTRRDANADGMADLFDYEHPNFDLPTLPPTPPADAECVPWGEDGE